MRLHVAYTMVRRRPWGYLVEQGHKGTPILGGFCNLPPEARVKGITGASLAMPGEDAIVTRARLTGALYCHRCGSSGVDPCEDIRAVMLVVQQKDSP